MMHFSFFLAATQYTPLLLIRKEQKGTKKMSGRAGHLFYYVFCVAQAFFLPRKKEPMTMTTTKTIR